MLGDGAVRERAGQAHRRIDRRRAGAARLMSNTPLPVAGRRDLDDGQVRLWPIGIGVVDRHRNRRTLGGRQVGVGDEPIATPHVGAAVD